MQEAAGVKKTDPGSGTGYRPGRWPSWRRGGVGSVERLCSPWRWSRLRDDVDLEHLAGDLAIVVSQTMQPSHVSVWLRTPEQEVGR